MDANRTSTDCSNRAGAGSLITSSRSATGSERSTSRRRDPVVGHQLSAPVISGAAALLASAFPNLTGKQIVQLLLTTADDRRAGRDAEYGNGILNIPRLPAAGRQRWRAAATWSRTRAPAMSDPMGDAGPRMTGVVILDGYSRAFVADLTQRLNAAPQQRPLEQGLQGDLSPASRRRPHDGVDHGAAEPARPGPGRLAQTGMTHEDARAARTVAGYALSRLTPRTAVALGFSESGRTLQQRPAERPARLPRRSRSDEPRRLLRRQRRRDGRAPGSRPGGADRDRRARVARRRRAAQRRLREPGYSLSSDRGPADRRGRPVARRRDSTSRPPFSAAASPSRRAATSYFLDVGARYDLGGGWETRALPAWLDEHARRQRPGRPAAACRPTHGHWTSAAATRSTTGDSLAFRVMQPLRSAPAAI